MRNVLVVSVNWLGDVLFSTPVYKAIKENCPGARVTALAVPRVRDVVTMCPFVDDVIVYDEDGEHRSLFGKLSIVARLRRCGFDTAFILRPSLSRTLLVLLAGIRERVGFSSKGHGLLTRVVSDEGCDDLHRADAYLRLLEGHGLKVTDRSPQVSVDDVSFAWAGRFLEARGIPEGARFIVLNTGGNWDLKQWPLENFAALARRVRTEMNTTVILPGTLRDRERIRRIVSLSGDNGIIPVADGTDLKQLAAIFKKAEYVISADSGPLHLASALGVNVVGIFGPTRPEITGPRGSGKIFVLQKDTGCNRAPCYYLECPDNKCMKAVTVDDVVQVIREFQG